MLIFQNFPSISLLLSFISISTIVFLKLPLYDKRNGIASGSPNLALNSIIFIPSRFYITTDKSQIFSCSKFNDSVYLLILLTTPYLFFLLFRYHLYY